MPQPQRYSEKINVDGIDRILLQTMQITIKCFTQKQFSVFWSVVLLHMLPSLAHLVNRGPASPDRSNHRLDPSSHRILPVCSRGCAAQPHDYVDGRMTPWQPHRP